MNLIRADLSGAVLGQDCFGSSEAFLNRANLTGANLSGANLTGVNLHDANLTYARLNGVTGWDTVTGKDTITCPRHCFFKLTMTP